MIIAGDIGGTKTNVALFADEGAHPGAIVVAESFSSARHDSLDEILTDFLSRHPASKITRACFGVAGPVVDGVVETSNLAWKINAEHLARSLGVEQVKLINDLEATAYGVETLRPGQLFTLSEGVGERPGGHRALIAAGTGLGMAGLFYDGAHYRPMPSEGGHVDFAPRDRDEVELLFYLQEKIGGHVSYERILSGPGLFNVYDFLRARGSYEEPAWLAGELVAGDPAAAISRAALAGKSELAVRALDIFVSIYGAMAGNLALILKPDGGVFVGGGIAPKILDKLKDGTFMRAYKDKGRLSYVIESIPVRVVMDDKAALYGAALCATL